MPKTKVRFDDIVFDKRFKHYWAGVCCECIEKHGIYHNEVEPPQGFICGVEGCNNEADYYIDFPQENVLPIDVQKYGRCDMTEDEIHADQLYDTLIEYLFEGYGQVIDDIIRKKDPDLLDAMIDDKDLTNDPVYIIPDILDQAGIEYSLDEFSNIVFNQDDEYIAEQVMIEARKRLGVTL